MKEEILLRYLTGKSDDHDLKYISEWISLDKSNAEWLFGIERLWALKDEGKYSQQDILDKAFDRFVEKNNLNDNSDIVEPAKKHSLFLWAKYVAAILVVAFLSVTIYKYAQPKENDTLYTMEVPKGQRAKLLLGDGTVVWLNSDSKLSYPNNFGKDSRVVELHGEAYFEVAKDTKKPFVVNSDQLDITVLGTKFNIKAYENELVEINLKEGKVQVEDKGMTQKIVLVPNQKLTYADNQFTVVSDAEIANSESWMIGEFRFQEEELIAIVKSIERKFDIEITISNPLLEKKRFTCRVQQNTSLFEILELLKSTRNLNYKKENNKIVIY